MADPKSGPQADPARRASPRSGPQADPGGRVSPKADPSPNADSASKASSKSDPKADALARLREVCLGLPETNERPSHGEPAFFVRDKKLFVMLDDDHHGSGHLAIWCAAPPGAQEALVATDPERYFRPPYVGPRGWLGVRLDADPSWDEIGEIIHDAYRQVAPKTLAALLDAPGR
jgi:hypothetical protein